jgi:hypothetical protein
MPGPLDPRTDKVMRMILLDKLFGHLLYVKLDELELENLNPLRDEVLTELRKIAPEARKGNTYESAH